MVSQKLEYIERELLNKTKEIKKLNDHMLDQSRRRREEKSSGDDLKMSDLDNFKMEEPTEVKELKAMLERMRSENKMLSQENTLVTNTLRSSMKKQREEVTRLKGQLGSVLNNLSQKNMDKEAVKESLRNVDSALSRSMQASPMRQTIEPDLSRSPSKPSQILKEELENLKRTSIETENNALYDKVSRLQNSVIDTESENQKLRSKLREVRMDVREFNRTHREMNTQLDKSKKSAGMMEVELNKAQSMMVEQERENDILKEKLYSSQNELDALRRSLQTANSKASQYGELAVNNDKMLTQQQDEIKHFEKQLKKIRREYRLKMKTLKKNNQTYKKEYKLAQEQRLQAEESKSQVEQKLHRVERDLLTLKENVLSQLQDNGEIDAIDVVRQMNQSITQRESQIASVTQDVSFINLKVKQSQQAVDKLRRQIDMYAPDENDLDNIDSELRSVSKLLTDVRDSVLKVKSSHPSHASAEPSEAYDTLTLKYKRIQKREFHLQEQLTNTKNLYQLLQAELENKQSQLESVKKDMESLKRAHRDERASLRTQLATHEQTIQKRNSELKDLKQLIEENSKRVERSHDTNSALQLDISRTNDEIRKYKKHMKQHITTIDRLEKSIIDKDDQIDNLERTLKENSMANVKLTELCTSQKTELDRTTKELSDKSKMLDETKADLMSSKTSTLEQLKVQQADMVYKSSTYENHIDKLNGRVYELSQKLEYTEQKLSTAESGYTQSKHQVSLLEDKCDSLKREIEEHRKSIQTLEHTNSTFEKELGKSTTMCEKQDAEIQQQRSFLEERNRYIKQYQQKLEDKEELYKDKVTSIRKEAKAEKAMMEEKYNVLLGEVKKALKQVESKTIELGEAKERVAQLNRDIQSSNSLHEKKDDTLKKLNQTLDEYQEQCSFQERCIREANGKISEMETILAKRDKNLASLKDMMDRYENTTLETSKSYELEKHQLMSKIDRLSTSVRGSDNAVTSLTQNNEAMNEELRVKTLELDAAMRDRKRLNEDAEKMAEELHSMRSKCARLEHSLENKSMEFNRLESNHREVSNLAESSTSSVNDLSNQLKNTRARAHELQNELEHFKLELASKNETIASNMKLISDLRSNLQINAETIRELKSQIEHADAQYAELRSDFMIEKQRLTSDLNMKIDEIDSKNRNATDSQKVMEVTRQKLQQTETLLYDQQKKNRLLTQKFRTFARQAKLQFKTVKYAMKETQIVASTELLQMQKEFENQFAVNLLEFLGTKFPAKWQQRIETLHAQLRMSQTNLKSELDRHQHETIDTNSQITNLKKALQEKSQECRRLEEIFQTNLVRDIQNISATLE